MWVVAYYIKKKGRPDQTLLFGPFHSAAKANAWNLDMPVQLQFGESASCEVLQILDSTRPER